MKTGVWSTDWLTVWVFVWTFVWAIDQSIDRLYGRSYGQLESLPSILVLICPVSSLMSPNVAGFTVNTVNGMTLAGRCVRNIAGPQLYLTSEAPTYRVSFSPSIMLNASMPQSRNSWHNEWWTSIRPRCLDCALQILSCHAVRISNIEKWMSEPDSEPFRSKRRSWWAEDAGGKC
jgi:hypothetical protein